MTPTHKSSLGKLEYLRLKVSMNQNPDLPHIFVVPKDIDCSELVTAFPNSKIIGLDPSNFKSLAAYNRLLLSSEFYKLFINFESILILQADAFLQKNVLPILDLDSDYIGAPWAKPFRVSTRGNEFHPDNNRHFLRFRERIQVGNGGLSWRRVQAMMEAIDYAQSQPYADNVFSGVHNEDLVISFIAKKINLKVPDTKIASMIFTENYWRFKHEMNSIYGFHALEKFKPELELALIKCIDSN